MQKPMQEDPLYATQEQQEVLDLQTDFSAVGFVRDEHPADGYVLLTPNAAKALVDKDIKVFMQHGFSEGSSYTDMDYADVGVEFEDDLFQLSNMVKVLVKYQPFSEYQTAFIKDRQTILSVQNPAEITASQMELLTMKRITMVALNLIEDENGRSMTEKILTETLSDVGKSIALSNFVVPVLAELTTAPILRFALQKVPALMDGILCFDGEVCNRDIADLLNLPYRNIVSLCWDLN